MKAAYLMCGASLMLAMASVSFGQNLLTDPGFELQTAAPNPNPNGVPGWANFGGAGFMNTPLAHSGTWVLDTPNEGGNYTVPGTYEDFAASAGQTYTFSAYVYTPNALVTNSNDFAILQLNYYTGSPPNNYAGGTGTTNGVNVGTPSGGGGVALPQGVWTPVSITATAPAGTNSMGVYLLDINADSNGEFYFDDTSLTLAPEPATFSLLSIASLAALRRRR